MRGLPDEEVARRVGTWWWELDTLGRFLLTKLVGGGFRVGVSKLLVQRALANLIAGRTVIVIAHRLSTLRNVDRIVTIEQGRLIEDGAPEALLGAGGRYAQLWRLQSGELASVTPLQLEASEARA